MSINRFAQFLLVTAAFYFNHTAHAAAVYPINNAAILAGSKFDIKVEFSQAVNLEEVVIDINSSPSNKLIGW